MKNILIKCLFAALFVGMVASCKEESPLPNGILTGINARVIFAYPDNTYFNLGDISNAALKFDLYSKNTDIDKIEYSAKYKNFASGITSAAKVVLTVPGSSVVGGKLLAASVTASDLATAFGVPGGAAGLAGGDSFSFTTKAYLTDGRTYDASNIASSIAQAPGTSSFTSAFTAYVGCASDQAPIVGKYTSIMTYTDDPADFPTPSTPQTVTITFKGPEPFRYNISEITAKAYVAFGGQAAGYPGDFFDICGVPVLLPTTTQFGTVVDWSAGPVPPFSVAKIDKATANTHIILNMFETNNQIKWTLDLVKQ